jgi:hypothetical protein
VIEVATVETLKSLLTTRDGVELDEDVAFAVGVNGDVNDLAVLLVALGLDLCLEVFDPVVTPVPLFPRIVLATLHTTRGKYILISIEGILDLDTLGSHGLIDDRSAGLADDRLGTLFGGLGIVAAS